MALYRKIAKDFPPKIIVEQINRPYSNKIFILWLVFLGCVFCISAQSPVRFYENGKAGFKNAAGEIIIPAQFASAGEFSEGFALIVENNKRGFINEKGQIVISPVYEDAGSFKNGIARVCIRGKYGFINKSGKTIIPFEFDFAEDFMEGVAREKKNGKFGFISPEGKTLISFDLEEAQNFSHGLAAVKKTGWGFINLKGEIKVELKFSSAYPFKNGCARAGDAIYYFDGNGSLLKQQSVKQDDKELKTMLRKGECHD